MGKTEYSEIFTNSEVSSTEKPKHSSKHHSKHHSKHTSKHESDVEELVKPFNLVCLKGERGERGPRGDMGPEGVRGKEGPRGHVPSGANLKTPRVLRFTHWR